MFGYCQTVVLVPYTKRLASSQGFDVRLLSDCYTDYYAPKAWLQAMVVMSKFCQTGVVFHALKT